MKKIYRIELPVPFPLKTTNVYWIDESPRTLVDTGIKTEESFNELTGWFRLHGFKFNSIERILITHGHIDHYGQAKKISSLTGAEIFIHPIEYGRIRTLLHSLGILRILLLKNGVPQELTNEALKYMETAQRWADNLEEAFFLSDGEEIPFRSMTWRSIHCPGHSPGLLCFYWKEEGILFTGDHLLKEITPNPVLNVPREGEPFQYNSLKDYLRSLKKIENLETRLLLPGHGEEIDDPKGLLQKVFDHHRQRMEHILSVLGDLEKTPYEITAELFPGVPPFEIFLGISEVLGHLQILKEQGRVTAEEKGGRDIYRLEQNPEAGLSPVRGVK
jgi:glyoxylase-like metal-dependent hydrolase (beta-lactamase superfamily II)